MSLPHWLNSWKKSPGAGSTRPGGMMDLLRRFPVDNRMSLCHLHRRMSPRHPAAHVARPSTATHGAPIDSPTDAITSTSPPAPSVAPSVSARSGAEAQLATVAAAPPPSAEHGSGTAPDAKRDSNSSSSSTLHEANQGPHARHAAEASPASPAGGSQATSDSHSSSRPNPNHPRRAPAAAVTNATGSASDTPPSDPPYADAMHGLFGWARPRPPRTRPAFLEAYPVPAGKLFNINSFLGKKDPLGGQYFVPQERYQDFLNAYLRALISGHQLFLTENYHQQVYKYFVELDWDWNTDLAVVMEVTPKLIDLVTRVVSEFYRYPYPNAITSIRTPYKVHLNFPQVLTTELLACMCRDRILAACREQLAQHDVDWERLVDFPHGSLRLMGSRKAPHMDSDPAWVVDKAYHPARLMDGKWRPGGITVGLLAAASIFPGPRQVAAFERSPAYVDMVFGDLDAYKQKMEERRRRRAERASGSEQQGGAGGGSGGAGIDLPRAPLPPGSRHNPLHVTLEVREDETVALKVYIKSRFRSKGQQGFNTSARKEAVSESQEQVSTVAPSPSPAEPPLPPPPLGSPVETARAAAPLAAAVPAAGAAVPTTSEEGSAAVAAALAAATAAAASAAAVVAPPMDAAPPAAGPEGLATASTSAPGAAREGPGKGLGFGSESASESGSESGSLGAGSEAPEAAPSRVSDGVSSGGQWSGAR